MLLLAAPFSSLPAAAFYRSSAAGPPIDSRQRREVLSPHQYKINLSNRAINFHFHINDLFSRLMFAVTGIDTCKLAADSIPTFRR